MAGETPLLVMRLLLAFFLYAFLAALFLILWHDLRRSARGEIASRGEGRLVVIKSGERGPEPGTVFPLQEVTSLGRAPTNTVVLADPFVSARHALIFWREGQWWLEDQGSRNGTMLNDEPVTRPTIVGAGDRIGIGSVVMRMEVGRE
ncbi:MAG: FHA domain-containing protein [Anaerolineae bacterium]|nr:FHA domain-containing protein [Anaerolineae bacterium]